MPIRTEVIRNARARSTGGRFKTLAEAKLNNQKTAFLCHSHRDAELVEGIIQLLGEDGWRIYVDWKDAAMPDKPNRETAKIIQTRITQADYFLFLATSNSTASRWCPCEIGYADGMKPLETIFVIPTSDGYSSYGNEYLDLYRKIDFASDGKLASWKPNMASGIYISNL